MDQQTDSEIKYLFKRYLLAHGTYTLTSLLKPGFHNRLGWDCFLGGHLCALWVEHWARHIKRANLTCSANFWARGLMLKGALPRHMRQSSQQWKASSVLIQSNYWKSIHCHLLVSDFGALAAGPIKDKLEWLSEMDSALGACVPCGTWITLHCTDTVLPWWQPSLYANPKFTGHQTTKECQVGVERRQQR